MISESTRGWFRFAVLVLLSGLASASHSQTQPADLLDAQPKVVDLLQGTKLLAVRMSLPPGKILAQGTTGPIECQCAQWGEISRWTKDVCVRWRGRPDNDGYQRCVEYKKVAYEQQQCVSWRQNFCNF